VAQNFEGLGVRVKGVVQGVGFRPFVFRLATSLGLKGGVQNTGDGVYIEIYGKESALRTFLSLLQKKAPPLAFIEEIETHPLNGNPPPLFTVWESTGEGRGARIPVDVAVCKACLSELFDPGNRRFRYPFINCTDCGPRFTVIEELPYDRQKTTMRVFKMCPDCLSEYSDPSNRRFHAEPNACPRCGPRVWLGLSHQGEPPEGDAIKEAIKALKEGKILALRGLGGFHLAADALNETVCAELRRRKNRPSKPLAIMVPDIETAHRLAVLSPEAEKSLLSPKRPIVLVPKREPSPLAPSVAPGLKFLGLMLPYTPLHHLLLREGGFKALVMTSGNLSGEPLCFRNQEALDRLSGLADLFLLHDREIVIGLDDSVVREIAGKIRPLRRARGFVPEPLPFPKGPSILAVGPLLKNTLCLTREDEAFVSQHIGDLDNLETQNFWQEIYEHFCHLLSVKPQAVACDLHPDYLSTQMAEKISRLLNLPLIKVPHHVAHAAAVMGEHGLEKALALCLDGLGLGPDGNLWGGELLWVEKGDYKRLGCFLPVPQPGGDQAARQPWRMLLSFLYLSLGEEGLKKGRKLLTGRVPEDRLSLVSQMIVKRFNTPLTSSCGRLFDACAALLGLAFQNRFEGEAPLRLESCAEEAHRLYGLGITLETLDPRPMIREILKDLEARVPPSQIAAAIHQSLAHGLARWLGLASQFTDSKEVVLAGGCFQNDFLTQELVLQLQKIGLRVFLPEKLPVNDGGLSYGQALWAAWSLSG